jgi:predicted flap endonuclease-1-like 5' DNA nuclease
VKRLGTIAGILIAMAAATAAALWLLRDRIAGPEPAPVEPDAAPRFRTPPPAPEPTPAATADDSGTVDDLTEITGIGPVYRARLAEAGIASFAALAHADAAAVAEAIGTGEAQVTDWAEQAATRRG